MSSAECEAVIDSYNQQYKNGWEMARYVAYVVAAVNTNKIKKPTDLVKFEWDDEKSDKPSISKEEIEIIQREMINRFNRSVIKE